MATVYLQRGRKKRLEQGHPWVFNNEVGKIDGEYAPGQLVDIVDHLGRYLATGYINPQSQIIVRVTSYVRITAMDKAFFVKRISDSWKIRQRFVENTVSCRVVYGEADFMPGVIIDKFAGVLVVQILTLGMDVCRSAIVEALVEVFQPQGIYERSDVSIRKLEGLEEVTGVLYGNCPNTVEIAENGLRMIVDIFEGQKTGYFHDQRENRASIAPLMKGWGSRSGITLREIRSAEGELEVIPFNANGKEVTFPYWDGANVLECFSHSGSFTLHSCKYGAKKVTCLDISDHAIESAKENVRLNGFTDRVEFVVADAFDYLRKQVSGIEEKSLRSGLDGKKVDTSKPISGQGRKWDVIILDPPAFAKTKSAVEGACRGYKDINLQALKLINEGGYLVTASCSYHMKPDLFLETIHDAAADAGKILRLIEWRGAGMDHPRILGVDEGHYLKFAIFEVRSMR